MITLLLSAATELLTAFDITTIIMVVLLVFFVIVEITKGVDYLKNKRKNREQVERNQEDHIHQLEVLENNNEKQIERICVEVASIKENVDLLLESDKNDIKAWITERYHYFMARGVIDDFSLDCIERRFQCYERSGGNSYVAGMVERLRELPRE